MCAQVAGMKLSALCFHMKIRNASVLVEWNTKYKETQQEMYLLCFQIKKNYFLKSHGQRTW